MSARSLLGELYAAEGRTEEASEQYRIVLQQSYRTELLDKAKAFLEAHPTKTHRRGAVNTQS